MTPDHDPYFYEVRKLDRQIFSVIIKLAIVFSLIACLFGEASFAATMIVVTLAIVITLFALTELARRI